MTEGVTLCLYVIFSTFFGQLKRKLKAGKVVDRAEAHAPLPRYALSFLSIILDAYDKGRLG